MKLVLILLTLHVTKCMSLQFPDIQPQHYHVPIVNIRGVNQSILYYKENNNDELINSILRELFTNQPVVLISGENVTTKGLGNRDPNTILLTETLNVKDFETEAFKTIIVSYWSVLYLVITTRNENYACENGTLNKNGFAETKKYLNELWQVFRIVRVIVAFPYTCPKHYIIYNGKEWSGTAVFNRSIKLITPNNNDELTSDITYSGSPLELTEDYPLRINIFNRFPTSITECNVVDQYTTLNLDIKSDARLCGLDGLIMDDYIKHYKYDILTPTDASCERYGFVDMEHNVTTGSLGCVVREKIDISFNSRFIWQYTKENYFYLHYVTQDALCVIMKRPIRIPLWHYVTNLFTPIIWIVLLIHLSFLGTVTWLTAKISTKFSDERPLKLHSYLLNAIHSAFFGVLLKNDGRFLILKGTSLLSSVILLAVYQGHVNYQFTTRSHYHEFRTLEELYDSPVILYTSPAIMELLKSGADPANTNQAAFLKRIQLRKTTATEYVIDHDYTATLARKQDVLIEVLKNHTDKYGTPLIYVVDESIQIFYLSFIARSGFLFIEESLKFMMRLLEAGLPNQYYIWTRRTYNLADSYPANGPEPRPFKTIKLKKLRTAFGFLLVGYVISGFVFIVERWKGKTKVSDKFKS